MTPPVILAFIMFGFTAITCELPRLWATQVECLLETPVMITFPTPMVVTQELMLHPLNVKFRELPRLSRLPVMVAVELIKLVVGALEQLMILRLLVTSTLPTDLPTDTLLVLEVTIISTILLPRDM